MTLALEATVEAFLALGRGLDGATPARLLAEVGAWYRDVRVEGADVGACDDMLLVEWGGHRLPSLDGPADLRPLERVALEAEPRAAVSVTRQVFAASRPDAEFDDEALHLTVALGFEPAARGGGGNRWIETPAGLDGGLEAVRGAPHVRERWARPAARTVVTVGFAS